MANSDNSIARIYRFADLEFDPRTLELRKAGGKVRLEGQPLRVLALLVQHAGDLVTREELRKQLWPSNTIVATRAALIRARVAVRAPRRMQCTGKRSRSTANTRLSP